MSSSHNLHQQEGTPVSLPINPIEAVATTADATGIADAHVGTHRILVEGGANFDLAPSSAEFLVSALAADLLNGITAAGERHGVTIAAASVDVITYFFAGLLGGVESDDPIGPHEFTATLRIEAPDADAATIARLRQDAEAGSAVVALLRSGALKHVAIEPEVVAQSGLRRHIADRAANLAAMRRSTSVTPEATDPAFWRRPLVAEARTSPVPYIAQVTTRDQFSLLIDSRHGLAPSPLELIATSLATCLTHTSIMHAALDGLTADSAVATVELKPEGDGQVSLQGTLRVGSDTGDADLAQNLGKEALDHCLLVHCYSRANKVSIR